MTISVNDLAMVKELPPEILYDYYLDQGIELHEYLKDKYNIICMDRFCTQLIISDLERFVYNRNELRDLLKIKKIIIDRLVYEPYQWKDGIYTWFSLPHGDAKYERHRIPYELYKKVCFVYKDRENCINNLEEQCLIYLLSEN